MSSKFEDPWRVIVEVKAGAGSDLLTLECGHQQTRDHRPLWGKRTRCFGPGCRKWVES